MEMDSLENLTKAVDSFPRKRHICSQEALHIILGTSQTPGSLLVMEPGWTQLFLAQAQLREVPTIISPCYSSESPRTCCFNSVSILYALKHQVARKGMGGGGRPVERPY